MKNKVIFISLDDWKVIYFNGQLFNQGHYISDKKLIRLGMLMHEAKIDISDIIDVYIDSDSVSDESILWNWGNCVEQLHDEIKEIINKNID